ncbi:MAG: tetraacyldisaccharide 4'-kinase, partial [Chlamydiia bacterium]|nr:tetraacyldisaccharide 4'-kinase [Chlamydiia bacterium]
VCERYCQSAIEGRSKGLLSRLTLAALRLASFGYRIAAGIRSFAYSKGLFIRYVAPVPAVVSIGNIVAGGTGKTPLTILLAEELYPHSKVGILTRGYRGKASKLKVPTRLIGKEGASVKNVGDEPAVMARRLKEVPLYVGRDRVQASIMAAKDGCEILLLDDGLQHTKLHRDIDIVLLDARDPLGQGYFLPRGYLRQSPKALEKADFIVGNHIRSEEEYAAFEKLVRKYSSAPLIAMTPTLSSIEDVQGAPKTQLVGAKVAIMCGIAKPQRFRELIEEMGAQVVLEKATADHTIPKAKEIARFSEKALAAGAEVLLVTEKDRVKLSDDLSCALPVASVQIRLKRTFGEENYQKMLEAIRARLK